MYHCALICCIYIHIHRSVVIGAKKGTADEVVRLDLVGLRHLNGYIYCATFLSRHFIFVEICRTTSSNCIFQGGGIFNVNNYFNRNFIDNL